VMMSSGSEFHNVAPMTGKARSPSVVEPEQVCVCMSASDMAMGWVDPWVGLGWVEFGQI